MNQEMKRRVTSCAAGFSLPRYRELPSVGLYLDQTVQLVNSCFRGFPGVELTPSMVSNYVKKGVISHPVKKKYSREQLASLIYIVLSKNVLSLENIDTLFQMQRAHCTAAEAYDYFCDEMENCLPFEVERSKEFAPIKNATGVDSVESARELCKLNGIEL